MKLISENVYYRPFVLAPLQGFEASGSIPRQIATHRVYQAVLRQRWRRWCAILSGGHGAITSVIRASGSCGDSAGAVSLFDAPFI
jgi:hypothetical protein